MAEPLPWRIETWVDKLKKSKTFYARTQINVNFFFANCVGQRQEVPPNLDFLLKLLESEILSGRIDS